MKKHFLTICAIALTGALFTSCLSDDNENESTQTFNFGGNDCFNRVTDLQTGSVYIGLTPTYTFAYKMIAGELDMQISNLRLAPDLGALSFQLPPMKFQQNMKDFFVDAKASNISPLNQDSYSGYIFNNITTSTFPGQRVFNVSYTLTNNYTQGQYKVDLYGTRYVYFGDITFTGENGSNVNEAKAETFVTVGLNPETMTATLLLTNVEPSVGQNVTFGAKKIPVTLTSDGFAMTTSSQDQPLQLYSSNLTSEMKDCTISNINVYGRLSTGVAITFDCDLAEKGKYSVSANNLRYLIYEKDNNNSGNTTPN